MTKIDIFSGFLGAGKTTLIKKLIKEAFAGEKLVLIENEFGSVGIDGGFMQDAGIEVTEMNSGCICCSLVGDFGKALTKVVETYAPERILIEPSGVGKLSDVIKAVQDVSTEEMVLNSFTTVVDANQCKKYAKNFGEFFNNQIEFANTVILSHTADISEEKLQRALNIVKNLNDHATIVTTDWDLLSGADIVAAMEHKNTLEGELAELLEHSHHHHHEHDENCTCGCHDHDHDHEHEHHHEHHHEHGEDCTCGCHDHDHDHEHEHHHEHHHEHGEDCTCGCHDHDHEHEHHHEHHHEHGEDCTCGCHDHDHHHHHADEVFTSWGKETPKKYTKEQIENILHALEDEKKYGMVLRAKGIVACAECQSWIHFDYTPGKPDVRCGTALPIGRLCVIGSAINEDALSELFEL